ncbi:hypothetical protein [Roseovarius sp.]|uniref:hypothetical protein n=1 Tax=Roseovarius sp. TaxID=1486281 RepID=UPI003A9810B3
MKTYKIALALPMFGLLAACDVGPDKTMDRNFFDKGHLSQMHAGIWVDPNGCDHWIIDDGVEGYLSQRLDKYGKPVCSGIAPPTVATGNFKQGSTRGFGDPI